MKQITFQPLSTYEAEDLEMLAYIKDQHETCFELPLQSIHHEDQDLGVQSESSIYNGSISITRVEGKIIHHNAIWNKSHKFPP